MSTDIKSMFASIQSAMEKKPKADSRFSDIMTFKPGNTYLVRLLPYVKDPTKTFFEYNMHSWTSVSTKQKVNYLCPSTFGLRSPITEEFFKLRKAGREDEAKHLSRQQSIMVNVYVINDPVTPENNGQVKILRYGKQLDKIIKAATVGDDAAEFGHRVFDLSENGCNFRIKVETTNDSKGGDNKKSYPTYVSSRFVSPSAIPEMTKEKIETILSSAFDLYTFFPSHTEDELKDALKVHFYGGSDGYVAPTVEEKKQYESKKPAAKIDDDEDDVPMNHAPKKQETAPAPQKTVTKSADSERVNKLLADFDDV